jgi:hypothetical protein
MEKKIELEAEMGRAFLELEKVKAAQAQITQHINALIKQIEQVKPGESDATQNN